MSLGGGGIAPRGARRGECEAHTECLVEGFDPRVEVVVRLWQQVVRRVFDREGRPADELTIAGRRYTSGWERDEREIRIAPLPGRAATLRKAGRRRAELVEDGAPAGALVWLWEPLHCTVEAWTDELRPALHRVRLIVANRMEADGGDPARRLLRTVHSPAVEMRCANASLVPSDGRDPLLSTAL
ncbi:MAG TPA: hypothetical protein VH703_04220 [Solirubrobacterales bacterium]|jgi:hypothetical protein